MSASQSLTHTVLRSAPGARCDVDALLGPYEGLRVGYAAGVFDGSLLGDAIFLLRARALCDRLIVAVYDDEFAASRRQRPRRDEQTRRRDVARLGIADVLTTVADDHARILGEHRITHSFHRANDLGDGHLDEYFQHRAREQLIEYAIHAVSIPDAERLAAVDGPRDAASGQQSLPQKVMDRVRMVFFDMDGTVYLGDKLLPGARELIETLDSRDIPYCYLTNNSSRIKADYIERLHALGLPADEERVILSTDWVRGFLDDANAERIFLLATNRVEQVFRSWGLETRSDDPEYVVLCFDRELTYDKLERASLFMQRGVPLVVSHPDRTCPHPEGAVPDAGVMTSLLCETAGVEPLRVLGKPSPDQLLRRIELENQRIARARPGVAPIEPAQVLMVGDRLDTDIQMAVNVGCMSALTLSGEPLLRQLERGVNLVHPDVIVANLAALS